MAFLLLVSCSKDSPVAPTPISQPTPPLPLGKEYILDSLAWQFYDSGSPILDELYLVSPERPDLFSNEYWFTLNATISLGFDTSANWTDIRPMYTSSGSPFYWRFYLDKRLLIAMDPHHRTLAGRKAAIRIRFR